METVVQAMSYDGLVTVVGCDKNMPGALMAMIRLNRPSILVYGGTIDSAVVGIELKSAEDFEPLVQKMKSRKFYGDYLNDKPALFDFLV